MPANPDLLAAINAWFIADPDLPAAFPGGLILSRAASGTAYPYCKVSFRRQIPESPEDLHAAALFRIYARSDDEAEAAGETLGGKLEDVTRPRFAYQWRGTNYAEARILAGVVEGSDFIGEGEKDPVTGDNVNVWRLIVPYDIWSVASSVLG